MVVLAVFAAAPAPMALTMPDGPSLFDRARLHAGAVWRPDRSRRLRRCLSPRHPADEAGRRGVAADGCRFSFNFSWAITSPTTRRARRRASILSRRASDAADHRARSNGRAPQILFSDDLDDKSVRWRFYLLKLQREDLWERARYFNADRLDPATVPPHSLLVLYADRSADRAADRHRPMHCGGRGEEHQRRPGRDDPQARRLNSRDRIIAAAGAMSSKQRGAPAAGRSAPPPRQQPTNDATGSIQSAAPIRALRVGRGTRRTSGTKNGNQERPSGANTLSASPPRSRKRNAGLKESQ